MPGREARRVPLGSVLDHEGASLFVVKRSVPHIDIAPLFGRLFSGRYKSLPIGLLKSGASFRLALGGNPDACTTLEGRSQQ